MTEEELLADAAKIHSQHSSCRNCCFAKYDGKTQVGCALGRLDKYREQGNVLEATDGDQEFDIVNGRKCPALRDRGSAWANAVAPDERVAQVRKELMIRTDVIIPLESAEDFVKLGRTLHSLGLLLLKVASVTIVNNQSAVKTGVIHALLLESAAVLSWQLTDVHERTNTNERVSRERLVDIVAPKLKGHFYSVVRAGDELPPTFTLDLDRAVTDNMERFAILTHKGVVHTVAIGFHRAAMVNGNVPVVADDLRDEQEEGYEPSGRVLNTVLEKAAFIAEAYGQSYLIAKVEELCPSHLW